MFDQECVKQTGHARAFESLAVTYQELVCLEPSALERAGGAAAIKRIDGRIGNDDRLPRFLSYRSARERADLVERACGNLNTVTAFAESDGNRFHKSRGQGQGPAARDYAADSSQL